MASRGVAITDDGSPQESDVVTAYGADDDHLRLVIPTLIFSDLHDRGPACLRHSLSFPLLVARARDARLRRPAGDARNAIARQPRVDASSTAGYNRAMAGPITDGGDDPPLEAVVEARTVAGMLLLPSADTIITPELISRGVWEPRETRYLTTLLRPGQTFVDVGAHVGYFSLFAARLVGPGGTVVAVEPEPRNLDLLQRNIARNGVDTVRVVPFAAAAAEATMSLALDEENRGGHRLVASDDPQAGPSVRCVRLDDVLPERVDVIKIDAQGYDHEVIEGLERTLAANPKATLLVELSRYELARRGIDPETVFARYEELDFLISRFGR